MRTRWIAGFALTVMACGGGNTTGPSPPPNFSGTYTGSGTVNATSTKPPDSFTTPPTPVTIDLALLADGNYDISTLVKGGGSFAGVVAINAAGVMSFPNFNPAIALQSVGSLFAGLCNTTGAVITPQGSVHDQTATVQLIINGAVCDWGAGKGTQDLRATTVTIQDQGTLP